MITVISGRPLFPQRALELSVLGAKLVGTATSAAPGHARPQAGLSWISDQLAIAERRAVSGNTPMAYRGDQKHSSAPSRGAGSSPPRGGPGW